MEFEFKGNKIKFNRELSGLDKLVLKFTRVLDKQAVEYVIISGYIAILFGRSRNTEDVDLFIAEMPFEKFGALWNALKKAGFECINESDVQDAYGRYLKSNLALRFAVKGTVIPNFELKFPKAKNQLYSLNRKIEVLLGKGKLNTSELELQVAYKLYLGSDKDFEDARHLYNVFKGHLDIGLLKKHIHELGVEKAAEAILWKKA